MYTYLINQNLGQHEEHSSTTESSHLLFPSQYPYTPEVNSILVFITFD